MIDLQLTAPKCGHYACYKRMTDNSLPRVAQSMLTKPFKSIGYVSDSQQRLVDVSLAF